MKRKLIALLLTLLLVCSVLPLPAAFALETQADAVSVKSLAKELAANGLLQTETSKSARYLQPLLQTVTLRANSSKELFALADTLMRAGTAQLTEQDADTQTPDNADETDAADSETTDTSAPNAEETTGTDAAESKPAQTSEPAKKSVHELVDYMKRQLFLRVDDPSAAAQLIADESGIDYDVIEGEGGTFYLHVDIEKNPQIFDYAVFRNLVDDLVEKQNAEMRKDPNGNYDYVMTYEHIAGELALHMLVFSAANGIMAVSGVRDGLILDLYRSAAVADLNITENRLPSKVFSWIGLLLYNLASIRMLLIRV